MQDNQYQRLSDKSIRRSKQIAKEMMPPKPPTMWKLIWEINGVEQEEINRNLNYGLLVDNIIRIKHLPQYASGKLIIKRT